MAGRKKKREEEGKGGKEGVRNGGRERGREGITSLKARKN